MRVVWHAASFYGMFNIAKNGFLASNDKELRHRILTNKPGTYVTPRKNCAWGYSPAQLLFHEESLPDDKQRRCKCFFECRTDVNKRLGTKIGKNDNVQHIYPETALQVVAIHIAKNSSPQDQEGRFATW